VTIAATLTRYPTKQPPLVTFQLEVLPCIVEMFTMATLTRVSYQISDPVLIWDLVGN